MRHQCPRLLEALGALLTGWVGVSFALWLLTHQFQNYREDYILGTAYAWGRTALALLLLGIYILVLLTRSRSRQEFEIEPMFSALGCGLGLLIGYGSVYLYSVTPALQQIPFLWFWVLSLPVLLSIVGFLVAGRVKSRRRLSNLLLSLARVLVPAALALVLTLFNYSGFPGVAAPAELRQSWAYKEFSHYDGVVNSLKQCRPIVDRIGTVNVVAPTEGKNYVFADSGSSGHSGELTLEVIGEKGTGVANLRFHIFTSVSKVQFTHQNKTEELNCWNPSIWQP